MNIRKIIASIFISAALVMGVYFFLQIDFPVGLEPYFKAAYYQRFGPLAICVELFIAGIYLLIRHSKANFVLALFGFTAVLDPFFSAIGLFKSIVPVIAMMIFLVSGLVALWLAFSNTFRLGRISIPWAIVSFILGTALELFFNYL